MGLINKPTLNVVDEDMMKDRIVQSLDRGTLSRRLVSEVSWNWLLERGLSPKFARIGVHREGCGGLWEQAYHQGYVPSPFRTRL